jgi:hypothetical protein
MRGYRWVLYEDANNIAFCVKISSKLGIFFWYQKDNAILHCRRKNACYLVDDCIKLYFYRLFDNFCKYIMPPLPPIKFCGVSRRLFMQKSSKNLFI